MLRTTILLPLFTFLVISRLYAQTDKPNFLLAYELTGLSPAGQDTVYTHYRSDTKMFMRDAGMFDKMTYPEIKTMFHQYFENRLSPEDLQVVLQHWDNKQVDFVQYTRERGIRYKAALECQKSVFDSVMAVYSPLLQSYFPDVRKTLTDEEIEQIAALHQNNRKVLARKKAEFLGYEERFTLGIDSSMYLYMKNAFEMMDNIPVSGYFSLLGAHNSQIPRMEGRGLGDYLNQYELFENAIIEGVNREGCRAQVAIPAYYKVNKPAVDRVHTIRNSLFFFVQYDSTIQNMRRMESAPPPVDTIIIEAVSTQGKIDSIIDKKLAASLHLKNMNLGFPNTVNFVRLNDKQKYEAIIGFHVITDAEERRTFATYRNNPEYRNRLQVLKTEDNHMVYYAVKSHEDTHTLRVDYTLDAFMLVRGELLEINLISPQRKPGAEDLKHALKILRKP